jgi:type IV pilus assembly protein PilX
VLQDRMVGNLRQDQLALQAAETALQAGLSYVESLKRPPDSGEIDFILNSCKYASDAACANWDAVLTNWRGSAESVNEGTSYGEVARRLETDGSEITVTLPEVAFQPRIYIQSHYLRPLDAEAAARGVGPHLFEVSAVGFGADANARVILQSTAPKVFSWH